MLVGRGQDHIPPRGLATVNEGVDAWRRIVRYIDHGRGIRFELMRNKWRTIRSRPIKSLEAVTIGTAEFENTVLDYVNAGGVQPGQDEIKSDLNAVLPPNLSEQLAVGISDSQYSYQAFRDFVLNQTALIVLNRNRLLIRAVVGNQEPRLFSSVNPNHFLEEPDEEESGEPGTLF